VHIKHSCWRVASSSITLECTVSDIDTAARCLRHLLAYTSQSSIDAALHSVLTAPTVFTTQEACKAIGTVWQEICKYVDGIGHKFPSWCFVKFLGFHTACPGRGSNGVPHKYECDPRKLSLQESTRSDM
jgi:hypothetical protein